MTFAHTVSRVVPNSIGDRSTIYGTYQFNAVTKGNLLLGLKVCEFIQLTPDATSFTTAFPAVSAASFPIAGSSVEIVGLTGQSGIFIAYGY